MSHRHASGRRKCVAVDPHVCLQPISGGGDGVTYSATGLPVAEYFAGFLFAHDRDGLPHRCEGFVRVGHSLNATPEELSGPLWTMSGSLKGGDLTLTPSVLCPEDGFHGFVRDGHWVTA